MTTSRSARLTGTGIVMAGGLVLFLSWLIPYLVSGANDRCIDLMRTSFYDQTTSVKVQCAAVGMLDQITLSFIFLGVVGVAYGLYALVKANRK